MSDEVEEGEVLQIDVALKRLDEHVQKIDGIASGKDARDLHDFVQDDLLPTIKMLADDLRICAAAIVRHEDAIAELEEGEQESQLLQEDADKILAFVEKAVEIFKAQRDEARKAKMPMASRLDDLINLGESVIEAVKDLVIEDEEEEEEPEPN